MQWLANFLADSSKSDHEELFEALEAAAPEDPTGLLITPHLIGSCNPEFDPLCGELSAVLVLGAPALNFTKVSSKGLPLNLI